MQFIAFMMAIAAAIIGAVISVFLRFFNKIYSPMLYVFWYPMVLSGSAYIMYFINPKIFNVEYYTVYDIGVLFLSGVMNILYNLFMGYSLRYEDASKLAPFSYLGPVILLVFDIELFGYSFTLLDIAGALTVLTFLLLKLYISSSQKVSK